MILLDGTSLTLEQLLAIADRGEPVALADAARERVRASRAVVDRRARGDEPVYGINTGFGSFAEVKIAPDALEALQLNLLRSHAAGVGDPLPVRAVRATMALRANVLAKGFSGIRVAHARSADRAAQPRRPSARAVARLGRRQRRPRAAGPSRAGADRRRRSARRSEEPQETAKTAEKSQTILCGLCGLRGSIRFVGPTRSPAPG